MLDAFTAVQLSLAAGIIFGAYVVRGLSGFGAGLVASPLLVMFLPVATVLPTTALTVFVLFIFLTLRDHGLVLWEEFWRLLWPTLIGVVAGLYLFIRLDAGVMLKLLGGFLMLYALYMLTARLIKRPQPYFSTRWAWPLGFAGAFIDALFGGGGGTLVVIYMHSRTQDRQAFRATLAVLWFAEMITRIAGYAMTGFYTGQTLSLVAFLLPFMLIGTWLGERFSARVSHETFSTIVAVLVLLSGLSLLLK
jgi:uncharacterized membrane protein YfcA